MTEIGIEDARKRLGDLVTAVQQGADVILTRNGKPSARLVRFQEETVTTSYTETFSFGNPFSIAELGMSPDMDQLLYRVIREHDDNAAIESEIEDAITEKIRNHGVTSEGEWLGEWSAEQVVRDILADHGVPSP